MPQNKHMWVWTASATQTIPLQRFWTNAFSKRNPKKAKKKGQVQDATKLQLYCVISWELSKFQIHWVQGKNHPPKREDHMILSSIFIFSNPNDLTPSHTHWFWGTRNEKNMMYLPTFSISISPFCCHVFTLHVSHLIVAAHSIRAHRIPPFPDRRRKGNPLIGNSWSKAVPVWAFGGYRGNLGTASEVGSWLLHQGWGIFLLRNRISTVGFFCPQTIHVLHLLWPSLLYLEMSEGYSPKWCKQR